MEESKHWREQRDQVVTYGEGLTRENLEKAVEKCLAKEKVDAEEFHAFVQPKTIEEEIKDFTKRVFAKERAEVGVPSAAPRTVRTVKRVYKQERNALCNCGSNKKYKKCCGTND